MAVILTDKDQLVRERKVLTKLEDLEDLKIPNFGFNKDKIEASFTIDDDRAFKSLYYSNIKHKETRAKFKRGKVIKVKTISNKDFIRRIKHRITIDRLLLFLKGIKQDLRSKLIGYGYEIR